jgi:hypothetical protein
MEPNARSRPLECGIYGSGREVKGVVCRAYDVLVSRVQGLGFRVEGSGSRVGVCSMGFKGLGFRVTGLECRV